MSDAPGPKDNYNIENSALLCVQKKILDLGICFDKREKGKNKHSDQTINYILYYISCYEHLLFEL